MVKTRAAGGWGDASPAELRTAMHGCLARLLLAPASSAVTGLLKEIAASRSLPAHLREAGLGDIPAAWAAAEAGEAALAQEWNDLFRVPLDRHVAPYESVHAPDGADGNPSGRESMLMSQATSSLRELYDAAGYEVDPAHSDLPDHAGIELGFLSCLVAQEAEADRAGDAATVRVARESQAQFLARHPARWLHALADRVDEKASQPFYRCVTRTAARIVSAELAALR